MASSSLADVNHPMLSALKPGCEASAVRKSSAGWFADQMSTTSLIVVIQQKKLPESETAIQIDTIVFFFDFRLRREELSS